MLKNFLTIPPIWLVVLTLKSSVNTTNNQFKLSGTVAVVNSKIQKMKATVMRVPVIVGNTAHLPCDIRSNSEDDRMKLVLWFRNVSDTPFYTFDAVNPKIQPLHWRDPDVPISFRSEFKPHPNRPVLVIKKTQLEDSGNYKCRVDYFLEQTTFQLIDLVVIIPPRKPQIYLDNGLAVEDTYSVKENQTIQLTCESVGGHPLPRLTWWKDGELIDSSFQKLQNKVVNMLYLDHLGRNDLNSQLVCQATNNNISKEVSTELLIDMKLPPLEVEIVDKSKNLIAEQNQTLQCKVSGSRPEPTITWWKNHVRMTAGIFQTSDGLNTTTSSIFFLPRISDTGSTVVCQAETPGLLLQKTDSMNITVYYAPSPQLKLGNNLNHTNIKEGDDIYFERRVSAFPSVKGIFWRLNDEDLRQDKLKGIIISGNSLAMQNIQREYVGNYSCIASNEVGRGESNLINLDIKYKPACSVDLQFIYQASKLQTVNISCSVNANPSDTLEFAWSFNNSANIMDIPKSDIQVYEALSVLSYTPRTELDFGTLICIASNSVGKGSPCSFTILPIGPPDPPSGCLASNVTYSSFRVTCDGISDNPNQLYTMEVKLATGESIQVLQNRSLDFQVVGLQSGTTYKVTIRSQNEHGMSDLVYMLVETLMEPIKQLAETKIKERESQDNHILPIFIGVLVTVILIGVMATLAVITLRLRIRLRRNNSSPIVNSSLLGERNSQIYTPTRNKSIGKSPSSQLSPSNSYVTYCRTISSDVEDFINDGYEKPVSTFSKRQDSHTVKKKGGKNASIASSPDSSCFLEDGSESSTMTRKLIHTPPPQYRGTPSELRNLKKGVKCNLKSPSDSEKESVI